MPDYQMSALLMAVYFRGLEPAELAALTDAMIDSGDRLRFDGLADPGRRQALDRRGGRQGVAAAGSHGGELRRRRADDVGARAWGTPAAPSTSSSRFPGSGPASPCREAREQVERLGCAMLGQTPEIAPADKRLYALRDVTATVESIPLIAASIMSKKLAEGLNGLVLDVKTGSGAFLTDTARALELARTMIGLGEARGCPTVALLTAMDRPLGRACGNALEVEEAIEGLRGGGPADLMEVTYALAAEMLVLVRAARDLADARRRLEEAVSLGAGARDVRADHRGPGGNPKVVEDPGVLPQAQAVEVYRADRGGVVQAVEPRRIGRAIVALGGGRMAVEDGVDPTVGFVITVKPGDPVRAGEPIASVFARDSAGVALGMGALGEAVAIGDSGHLTPLVSHRITVRGVELLAEHA